MTTKKLLSQDHLIKIMDQAILEKSMKLNQEKQDLKPVTSKSLSFSNYPSYTLKSQFKKYLPKSLSHNFFEKLSLVLLVTLSFNLSPKAANRSAIKSGLSSLSSLSTQLKNTEATTCMDGCKSRAPQSTLLKDLIKIPHVQKGFARVEKVAIFDEDNREAISDLREKDPSTLNKEELAILKASAQTGRLSCTGGGANATLIQLPDGRDAVITSAHSFLDKETGQPRCDLSKANYLPNINFHNGKDTNFSDFSLRTVGIKGSPLNLENVRGNYKVKTSQDFLIFVLDEKISSDQMPDGSIRGSMRFETKSKSSIVGFNYLIGFSKDFRDGLSSSYQKCTYDIALETNYNECDATYSSSSSAITRLDNEEMVLSGIMIGEWEDDKRVNRLTPKKIYERNVGLPIEHVRQFLNNEDLSI